MDEATKITARTLHADVARKSLDADDPGRTGDLQLGSDLDIKQVRGSGGVAVESPTRVVLCHEFEYNLLTSLASAFAAPGGRVSVKTRGEPNPFFAERIRWNLATDRIEVRRAGGAGTP